MTPLGCSFSGMQLPGILYGFASLQWWALEPEKALSASCAHVSTGTSQQITLRILPEATFRHGARRHDLRKPGKPVLAAGLHLRDLKYSKATGPTPCSYSLPLQS